MTDKLIEKIKADREAGTPGPWRIVDCDSYGDRCKVFFKEIWNDETDILVTTEVTRAHNDGGAANIRRIARVPDMEARILADAEALKAADELAEAVAALTERKVSPVTGGRLILEVEVKHAEQALANYNAKRGARDE
jgi:hypothetical protein